MRILVVDGTCPHCSELGAEVSRNSSLRVESRGGDLIRNIGNMPSADGPMLIDVEDDRVVKVWRGWAMRARVGIAMGPKHLPHWPAFLWNESRARDLKERNGVSRRTVILGVLAGVVTSAAGTRQAAAQDLHLGPARAASHIELVAFLKSHPEARQSEATWGAVSEMETVRTPQCNITVLRHAKDPERLRTFLAMSGEGEVEAAIVQYVDDVGGVFEFSLPSGQALGTFTPEQQGTAVKLVEVARPRTHLPNAELLSVQPDSLSSFTTCWKNCLGVVLYELDATCRGVCFDCAASGSVASYACLKCGWCAGAIGIICARDCKGK